MVGMNLILCRFVGRSRPSSDQWGATQNSFSKGAITQNMHRRFTGFATEGTCGVNQDAFHGKA